MFIQYNQIKATSHKKSQYWRSIPLALAISHVEGILIRIQWIRVLILSLIWGVVLQTFETRLKVNLFVPAFSTHDQSSSSVRNSLRMEPMDSRYWLKLSWNFVQFYKFTSWNKIKAQHQLQLLFFGAKTVLPRIFFFFFSNSYKIYWCRIVVWKMNNCLSRSQVLSGITGRSCDPPCASGNELV